MLSELQVKEGAYTSPNVTRIKPRRIMVGSCKERDHKEGVNVGRRKGLKWISGIRTRGELYRTW
jgi:hypothetical protein